jgi:hypothetical protein
MNVHLETMLKLEFTPAVETETERSALIFRLKRLAQLCTEPRKVYILVREFIGEYPLRLLFRAEFTGFKITNLEIAAGDDQ